MKKRVLATFLLVCMLITLFPAMEQKAEAAAKEVTISEPITGAKLRSALGSNGLRIKINKNDSKYYEIPDNNETITYLSTNTSYYYSYYYKITSWRWTSYNEFKIKFQPTINVHDGTIALGSNPITEEDVFNAIYGGGTPTLTWNPNNMKIQRRAGWFNTDWSKYETGYFNEVNKEYGVRLVFYSSTIGGKTYVAMDTGEVKVKVVEGATTPTINVHNGTIKRTKASVTVADVFNAIYGGGTPALTYDSSKMKLQCRSGWQILDSDWSMISDGDLNDLGTYTIRICFYRSVIGGVTYQAMDTGGVTVTVESASDVSVHDGAVVLGSDRSEAALKKLVFDACVSSTGGTPNNITVDDVEMLLLVGTLLGDEKWKALDYVKDDDWEERNNHSFGEGSGGTEKVRIRFKGNNDYIESAYKTVTVSYKFESGITLKSGEQSAAGWSTASDLKLHLCNAMISSSTPAITSSNIANVEVKYLAKEGEWKDLTFVPSADEKTAGYHAFGDGANGRESVKLTYLGDSTYGKSASVTGTVVVKSDPTITLTAPANRLAGWAEAESIDSFVFDAVYSSGTPSLTASDVTVEYLAGKVGETEYWRSLDYTVSGGDVPEAAAHAFGGSSDGKEKVRLSYPGSKEYFSGVSNVVTVTLRDPSSISLKSNGCISQKDLYSGINRITDLATLNYIVFSAVYDSGTPTLGSSDIKVEYLIYTDSSQHWGELNATQSGSGLTVAQFHLFGESADGLETVRITYSGSNDYFGTQATTVMRVKKTSVVKKKVGLLTALDWAECQSTDALKAYIFSKVYNSTGSLPTVTSSDLSKLDIQYSPDGSGTVWKALDYQPAAEETTYHTFGNASDGKEKVALTYLGDEIYNASDPTEATITVKSTSTLTLKSGAVITSAEFFTRDKSTGVVSGITDEATAKALVFSKIYSTGKPVQTADTVVIEYLICNTGGYNYWGKLTATQDDRFDASLFHAFGFSTDGTETVRMVYAGTNSTLPVSKETTIRIKKLSYIDVEPDAQSAAGWAESSDLKAQLFTAVYVDSAPALTTADLSKLTVEYSPDGLGTVWKALDYQPTAGETTYHKFGLSATGNELIRLTYQGDTVYDASASVTATVITRVASSLTLKTCTTTSDEVFALSSNTVSVKLTAAELQELLFGKVYDTATPAMTNSVVTMEYLIYDSGTTKYWGKLDAASDTRVAAANFHAFGFSADGLETVRVHFIGDNDYLPIDKDIQIRVKKLAFISVKSGEQSAAGWSVAADLKAHLFTAVYSVGAPALTAADLSLLTVEYSPDGSGTVWKALDYQPTVGETTYHKFGLSATGKELIRLTYQGDTVYDESAPATATVVTRIAPTITLTSGTVTSTDLFTRNSSTGVVEVAAAADRQALTFTAAYSTSTPAMTKDNVTIEYLICQVQDTKYWGELDAASDSRFDAGLFHAFGFSSDGLETVRISYAGDNDYLPGSNEVQIRVKKLAYVDVKDGTQDATGWSRSADLKAHLFTAVYSASAPALTTADLSKLTIEYTPDGKSTVWKALNYTPGAQETDYHVFGLSSDGYEIIRLTYQGDTVYDASQSITATVTVRIDGSLTLRSGTVTSTDLFTRNSSTGAVEVAAAADRQALTFTAAYSTSTPTMTKDNVTIEYLICQVQDTKYWGKLDAASDSRFDAGLFHAFGFSNDGLETVRLSYAGDNDYLPISKEVQIRVKKLAYIDLKDGIQSAADWAVCADLKAHLFTAVYGASAPALTTADLSKLTIEYTPDGKSTVWKALNYTPGAQETDYHVFGLSSNGYEIIRLTYQGDTVYDGSQSVTATVEVRVSSSLTLNNGTIDVYDIFARNVSTGLVERTNDAAVLDSTIFDAVYESSIPTLTVSDVTVEYLIYSDGSTKYWGSPQILTDSRLTQQQFHAFGYSADSKETVRISFGGDNDYLPLSMEAEVDIPALTVTITQDKMITISDTGSIAAPLMSKILSEIAFTDPDSKDIGVIESEMSFDSAVLTPGITHAQKMEIRFTGNRMFKPAEAEISVYWGENKPMLNISSMTLVQGEELKPDISMSEDILYLVLYTSVDGSFVSVTIPDETKNAMTVGGVNIYQLLSNAAAGSGMTTAQLEQIIAQLKGQTEEQSPQSQLQLMSAGSSFDIDCLEELLKQIRTLPKEDVNILLNALPEQAGQYVASVICADEAYEIITDSADLTILKQAPAENEKIKFTSGTEEAFAMSYQQALTYDFGAGLYVNDVLSATPVSIRYAGVTALGEMKVSDSPILNAGIYTQCAYTDSALPVSRIYQISKLNTTAVMTNGNEYGVYDDICYVVPVDGQPHDMTYTVTAEDGTDLTAQAVCTYGEGENATTEIPSRAGEYTVTVTFVGNSGFVASSVQATLVICDHCGHGRIYRDAVEPTCTECGYKDDEYCDYCGGLDKDGAYIPPNGHSWVLDSSTEKKNGDIDVAYHCFVCGASQYETFEDMIKDTIPNLSFVQDYKSCNQGSACELDSYSDLTNSGWYHDAVHFCLSNGLMNGTTSTTFEPAGEVTRAQVWMVLARLSGEHPESLAVARQWAMNRGISDGTNPNKKVNRQQLATMLYRYALRYGGKAVEGTELIESFTDRSQIADYALEALEWCCANGIVSGYPEGDVRPNGSAQRVHLASIVMKFAQVFYTK